MSSGYVGTLPSDRVSAHQEAVSGESDAEHVLEAHSARAGVHSQ